MCYFSALIALGFLVIHTFSMIIAFNAYDERKKSDQIFVPVVHMTAAVMVRTRSCLVSVVLIVTFFWRSCTLLVCHLINVNNA
jgi:hypothetical protein